MKQQKTLRREKYKSSLTKLLAERPEANKVDERYRVMRYVLNSEWTNLVNSVDKEVMYKFLQDVVYVDRLIRKQTEGQDNEQKTILSQEFQLEELPKM